MRPKVLVAGIGNIFLGDDAFGSEAARRLLRREWPPDVRVEDFGIRGFDLTFALMDGYETIVMVDATPRGGAPGTLYCIEADLSHVQQAAVETHGMNPMRVLATARSMGAQFEKAYVVGCEPDPESVDRTVRGSMGLSPAVEASLDEAVRMVEELVERVLEGRSFQKEHDMLKFSKIVGMVVLAAATIGFWRIFPTSNATCAWQRCNARALDRAEHRGDRQRRGGAAAGSRVEAVHLRLGPLSGVVKDSLLFAWELACEETPVAGSRLAIEEVGVRVKCPVCGAESDITASSTSAVPPAATRSPTSSAGGNWRSPRWSWRGRRARRS